jgi:glycosyltransferase involved in cell wall biosynthesis
VWPEAGIEREEVEGTRVLRVHRDDLYFDHYARLFHPGVEGLIEEVLDEERPDVVHLHQWIRLTCNPVELAARRGIPSVVTLHDLYTSCPRCFRVRPDDEPCFRPLSVESCGDCAPRFGHESEREVAESIELYRDQYRAELAQAAAVLTATTATGELVCETTGQDSSRLELLPLPYAPRFCGADPAPLPGEDAPLRIGYWGVVTHRKGVQVLVRAFRDLLAGGAPRPVELHVFGGIDTPALGAELEALAEDLPVTFHGRYEHADVARAGLHLAVFPMLCFETYGFVLDECFELGLPCVVTDIGALPRRAGEAALRVPPGDAAALAEVLRGVLARPALLDELRARIPRVSLSPEEHLARLLAVYEAAVASGPREAAPVSAWRRARLLMLQRESAVGRVCPEGGPR